MQEFDSDENSLRLCSESIAKEPKNSSAWASRGYSYLGMKRYLEAIQDYDEVIKLDPTNPDAWAYRGEAQRKLRNYEDAIRDFDEAVRLKRNFAWALIRRQRAQKKAIIAGKGRREKEAAIENLNKMILLNSQDEFAWLSRGEVKMQLGQYEEAVQDLNEVLRLNPKNISAARKLKLTQQLIEQARKKSSTDAYTNTFNNPPASHDLSFNPTNADALAQRARAKSKLGQHEEALHDLDEAIKLDPNCAFAWEVRSLVQVAVGDRTGAVLSAIQSYKLNAENASDLDVRVRAKLNLGRYEEAIGELDEEIKSDPRSSSLWRYRAKVKRVGERYEEALHDLEEAFKLDPNNTYEVQKLKEEKEKLVERKKQEQELEADKEVSSRKNNNNSDINEKKLRNQVRINLAEKYFQNGEYAEALICWNKILVENPEDFVAWGTRGKVRIKLGQKEEAFRDLTQAIKLNPENSFECWFERENLISLFLNFREIFQSTEASLERFSGTPNVLSKKSVPLFDVKKIVEDRPREEVPVGGQLSVLPNGWGVISRYRDGYLEVLVKNFLGDEFFKIEDKFQFSREPEVFSALSRDKKFLTLVMISLERNKEWTFNGYCTSYTVSLLQREVKKNIEKKMIYNQCYNGPTSTTLLDERTLLLVSSQDNGNGITKPLARVLDLVASTITGLDWDGELKNPKRMTLFPSDDGVLAVIVYYEKTYFFSKPTDHASLLLLDVRTRKTLASFSFEKAADSRAPFAIPSFGNMLFNHSQAFIVFVSESNNVEIWECKKEYKQLYHWKAAKSDCFDNKRLKINLFQYRPHTPIVIAASEKYQVVLAGTNLNNEVAFCFCVPSQPMQYISFKSSILKDFVRSCFDNRNCYSKGYFVNEETYFLSSLNALFIASRDPRTFIWSIAKCYDLDSQSIMDAPRCLTFDAKFKSLSKAQCIEEANLHHENGEYEEAIKYWDRLIAENPKDFYVWERRGESKRKLNQDEEALLDLNEAIKLNPKSDFALARRGEVKRQLKNEKEALQDLDEAIRLNPRNDFALGVRGQMRRGLGYNEEALKDLDEAIAVNPKNVFALSIRGAMRRHSKKYNEALEDLNKVIELDPMHAYSWGQRGAAKRALGQLEEAIQDLNKALDLDPKNEFAWSSRALAKFSKGQYKEALQDFDELVKLNAKWEEDSDLLYMRGVAKREVGEWEAALQDLNKAIALNPMSDETWELRGIVKLHFNLFEEAISDLDEAFKLNPRRGSVCYYRGCALRTLGRNEEAHLEFSKGIKLNPHDIAGRRERGIIRREGGFYERALRDLEKVLKLDPKDSVALQEIEKTKAQMKNKQNVSTRIISHEKLKCVENVGKGSFATVQEGEWQFEESYEMPVAIKQLKMEGVLSEKSVRDFRKEVEIHAKLKCSSIVELIGISDQQPFCMVMEFVDGGSLRTLLDSQQDRPYAERIDWNIRLQIAKDIAVGVEYLHGQKPFAIVHSDLKSPNVLLDKNYRAKLCDFGLSKLKMGVSGEYSAHDNNQPEKPKGTLLWKAPELFSKTARQSTASDIFSLAIVLWELASFVQPCEDIDKNAEVIKHKLDKGQREIFDDERTPNTPKEYVELVKHCWDGEPEKRPDAATVVVKLEAIFSKNPLAPTVFSSSPKKSEVSPDVSPLETRKKQLLTFSDTSSRSYI